MLDTKMNMISNQSYANDLWRCDFCRSVDTQTHTMVPSICPS